MPRKPEHLFVLAFPLLAALGCEVPPPPAAAPRDNGDAGRAAATALRNLQTRNFPLENCLQGAPVRTVATKEQAFEAANGKEPCSIYAVHKADGQWLIVVRSGASQANPQARVTVTANAEGIVAVVYQR